MVEFGLKTLSNKVVVASAEKIHVEDAERLVLLLYNRNQTELFELLDKERIKEVTLNGRSVKVTELCQGEEYEKRFLRKVRWYLEYYVRKTVQDQEYQNWFGEFENEFLSICGSEIEEVREFKCKVGLEVIFDALSDLQRDYLSGIGKRAADKIRENSCLMTEFIKPFEEYLYLNGKAVVDVVGDYVYVTFLKFKKE